MCGTFQSATFANILL